MVLSEGDFGGELELEGLVGEVEAAVDVVGAEGGDGLDAEGDVLRGEEGERGEEKECKSAHGFFRFEVGDGMGGEEGFGKLFCANWEREVEWEG